jgi:hypothetical protein
MIVNALNKDKEAPWFGEYRGKEQTGLTREKLSARLRRYKVKPKRLWHPEIKQELRGYFFADVDEPKNGLKHVFAQYLPDRTAI